MRWAALLVQERKRKMYPQIYYKKKEKYKRHTLKKVQLAKKESTALILSQRRLVLWLKTSLQMGKGHKS